MQFNSWYPFGQEVDVERLKQSADVAAAIGAEAYVRCQLDFAKPAVRRWARDGRASRDDVQAWLDQDRYNIDAGDRFDPARPERAGARLHDHLVHDYQWLDELRAA